jgi:phage repressor protein C with HTH and peptisase S24 domain
MDKMRELIFARMLERGTNMAEVSFAIKRGTTFMYDFLKRGKPERLREEDRRAIAQHLDLDEDLLRAPSPTVPAKEYVKKSPTNKNMAGSVQNVTSNVSEIGHSAAHHPSARMPADDLFGAHDLPVYSTVQTDGGALVLTKTAVNFVERPAPLLRVLDSYGVIVHGNSMDPIAKSGSTVLVNPHLPAREGDLCVFRTDDGQVMVRELERFTDHAWHVKQQHPRRASDIKRSEWKAHVIVGLYYSR